MVMMNHEFPQLTGMNPRRAGSLPAARIDPAQAFHRANAGSTDLFQGNSMENQGFLPAKTKVFLWFSVDFHSKSGTNLSILWPVPGLGA